MEEFARRWCTFHFRFIQTTQGEAPVTHQYIRPEFPQPCAWEQFATYGDPENRTGEPSYDLRAHSVRSQGPPAEICSSSAQVLADISRCARLEDEEEESESSSSSEVGPVEEAPPDLAARAGYLRLLLASEQHRRERRLALRAAAPPAVLRLDGDAESERRRQMQQLYGAAAERVAAVEGRAQLLFDRYTDEQRPPLWPNIPLVMRFT